MFAVKRSALAQRDGRAGHRRQPADTRSLCLSTILQTLSCICFVRRPALASPDVNCWRGWHILAWMVAKATSQNSDRERQCHARKNEWPMQLHCCSNFVCYSNYCCKCKSVEQNPCKCKCLQVVLTLLLNNPCQSVSPPCWAHCVFCMHSLRSEQQPWRLVTIVPF